MDWDIAHLIFHTSIKHEKNHWKIKIDKNQDQLKLITYSRTYINTILKTIMESGTS